MPVESHSRAVSAQTGRLVETCLQVETCLSPPTVDVDYRRVDEYEVD